MSGTLIFIIIHIIIIFSYILLGILNILNFKNIEKKIKARKDYLSHLNELIEEHNNYINKLIFLALALAIIIFSLIVQIIRCCM